MESFKKYKQLGKKEQDEVQALCRDIEKEMLIKDKKIAKWLGLEEQGVVCLVRKLLDFYDWIESKKIRKQEISLEESTFFDVSEDKEGIVPTKVTKLDKSMLLLAECGITDYGIEERKAQIRHQDSASNILNKK